jgi:hypothetical protein
VRDAEPNFLRYPTSQFVPNDPLFDQQWGLLNIGQAHGTSQFGGTFTGTEGADIKATEAWDVTTGAPGDGTRMDIVVLQVLNALFYASILFLIASGLSLIFGVMRLVNLAHGDLDEVYTRSRSELHALIDIAMGGMVAEELWFGESSTGPSGDLLSATRVAAEIVGAAGLAGSLVSLAAVQTGPFSDTNLVGRVLADPRARPEVDRILAVSKARARALLDANRHVVEALRDALLDRDELIGDEILEVARGAGEPVRTGLQVERRGGERRSEDVLADAELSTLYARVDPADPA